jgi:polyribonucleotide nucleotidyltransferase
MFNIIQKSIEIGDGRSISIETGKMAKQADGSVVVRQGDTMLLATIVSAKEANENVDFMPLSVEYKEKFASSGRFPGGFMKREARASDYEILISRLVDRVLRPLFPDDYHAETFVNVYLISADNNIIPDALAGLAASAAIAVSDVPFNGPISEVRVGRINGQFKINPTFSDLKESDMDIMVGASMENIMMIEGEMNEISEAEMLEAIKFAHEAIKQQCQLQIDLAKAVNKQKREYNHETNDPELKEQMIRELYQKAYDHAASQTNDKHKRSEGFSQIISEFVEKQKTLKAAEEINLALIGRYYHEIEKNAVRNFMLDKNARLDGRKPDEIRQIFSEVDILPSPHGSALFTRGETQSLTTVTLGTRLDEKIIDEALIRGTEKFVLHYNFPPFSTGDAKPSRGLSRREIGHGNLAHRALKRMVPAENEIPYTVRVVSDILESNGSSSMATVCAGTLALMDAGVQMKKPVSGIAMGMITDKETGRYIVLSDILGDEDHLGDMDFKVTGTKDGITATQMDIKVDGLSYEILANALEQAKQGRLHILNEMMKTLSKPREDYKPHAPRIVRLEIVKEMIGALIGPGGKVIQEIQRETGTVITIEEVNGRGVVDVSAINKDAIDAALSRINRIVEVPEIGKVYKGKVKSIVQFGAFVEILPRTEGLLHISEIEWRRLNTVDEVLKMGDEIEVKLIDIDSKTGKFKLSRKVLLPKPEKE